MSFSFYNWRWKLDRLQAAATVAMAAQQASPAFVLVHVHHAGGQSNLFADRGDRNNQRVASRFLPARTRVQIPASQGQLLLAAINRLVAGTTSTDELDR